MNIASWLCLWLIILKFYMVNLNFTCSFGDLEFTCALLVSFIFMVTEIFYKLKKIGHISKNI